MRCSPKGSHLIHLTSAVFPISHSNEHRLHNICSGQHIINFTSVHVYVAYPMNQCDVDPSLKQQLKSFFFGGGGGKHIMSMLFHCILISYDAYFNHPVLVLVYNIVWF